MRICAFIQMHNEAQKGNLTRCLENVRQWADDIVIYDDASTDNSVEIALNYTNHIIRGKKNCFKEELFHKQQLLELALSLKPDWIMWIDCDEILDREATTGGLRKVAENAPPTVNAYSFHQLNLWRSQTYARIDSLFDKGWFCRLWRVTPNIHFETKAGIHLRIYPITITKISVVQSQYRVIHYGFWDYKQTMMKIGASYKDYDILYRVASENWILNETKCECYKVPTEVFPRENIPPDIWPKPEPRAIKSLLLRQDVEDSHTTLICEKPK